MERLKLHDARPVQRLHNYKNHPGLHGGKTHLQDANCRHCGDRLEVTSGSSLRPHKLASLGLRTLPSHVTTMPGHMNLTRRMRREPELTERMI